MRRLMSLAATVVLSVVCAQAVGAQPLPSDFAGYAVAQVPTPGCEAHVAFRMANLPLATDAGSWDLYLTPPPNAPTCLRADIWDGSVTIVNRGDGALDLFFANNSALGAVALLPGDPVVQGAFIARGPCWWIATYTTHVTAYGTGLRVRVEPFVEP